jgi:DNA polymerase III subunit beta
MRFTFERSILLKEISIANEIIASKNAISILSNIYLETKEGSLTIKATDRSVNFETKVPVTVLEDGSVTVYGEKFFGIINSVPDGEIEFEQVDNKINIKTAVKKARFQLKSIASEKFPEFSASGKEHFEIPVRDLKDMIGQTIFAISDDETRYFMNGVYFEKADDKFVMVATDGRRLAFINKSVSGIPDFPGIIIPPKILNIVLKRAGDEGMAGISITDKTIFIQFGSYKLSSVLIEGQFPNYRRVIPENQTNRFTVNRNETLDALKRVSLLVEQKSHRLYLNLSSGSVSIYCEESDIGNAREEIPCKYDGEEVTIALNYRYLEEPFKAMNAEEISVLFSDPNKTITISPVPEKDFFHIVMPMQQE